jgi:MFS family permease
MGWGNALLVVFFFVERRVPDPMFRLDLFRNRMFALGNISGFLAANARGGLQFVLIIWLQGIWLPIHGYRFEDTPLWAGIYMVPLTIGFLILGPLSGYLSDHFGSRAFAIGGMLITTAGFIGLLLLPANFSYTIFALLLLVLGIGMGMFAAPNTTAIMNAVPPEYHGVSSGMRATFQNVASTLSITVIFSLVTIGLASALPDTMYRGLTQVGIPAQVANMVAHLPPTGAALRRVPRLQPDGNSPAARGAPGASQRHSGDDSWPAVLSELDLRPVHDRRRRRLLDFGRALVHGRGHLALSG